MKAIVSRDGMQLVAIVSDEVRTRADVTRVYVDEAKSAPPFDAKTQKLEERWTFSPTTVTRSFVAVPLTADELVEAAAASELEQIRAVLDALRGGAGTVAERVQRLERVLHHVATRLIRNRVLP